ncbi:hypothetical protein AB4Z48_33970 [Cupriavidus sp. 2TAF22]|uniref:hypothetical protein n=1 Tax=unclassified Cupriavidus TaxID=2640874 RepID=UPI003F92042F
MQQKLECKTKYFSRLVTKSLVIIKFFYISSFSFSQTSFASQKIEAVHANSIKNGCSVIFQETAPSMSESVSEAVSGNIDAGWSCEDGTAVIIDTYEKEGGPPEILSSFIRADKCIVVLVRWNINSRASSFNGDMYRVFIYRYGENIAGDPFFVRRELLGENKVGWDGVKNGRRVKFSLNTENKINKELDNGGKLIDCR